MTDTPPLRVLIVGVGNMGRSHALAHLALGSEIVALVNRSARTLEPPLRDLPRVASFEAGLALRPDLVVVASWPETHADFAIRAMETGAHVFVEKPLGVTGAEARRVVAVAVALGRKLVVGYILRHHPSWQRLIAEARALGGPYVFRMNLNQQSSGAEWEVHKALMRHVSPIVDCGVHYVDVMCQITDAAPVRVQGIGLRLSDEIAPDMYNYGQLQVTFADRSVGWYEAGWGPMMSETAFFVKDVISPAGSVSIVDAARDGSSDIGGHTRVGRLLVHRPTGDRVVEPEEEPDHDALCRAEQAHLLRAIAQDVDLARHMKDAVTSLEICLAADESIREGRVVTLGQD